MPRISRLNYLLLNTIKYFNNLKSDVFLDIQFFFLYIYVYYYINLIICFRHVLTAVQKIQHGQVLLMVYLFVWTVPQCTEAWEFI